jgi:hypothetical protein
VARGRNFADTDFVAEQHPTALAASVNQKSRSSAHLRERTHRSDVEAAAHVAVLIVSDSDLDLDDAGQGSRAGRGESGRVDETLGARRHVLQPGKLGAAVRDTRHAQEFTAG